MKKLDNKGMTLVEIIVSVVLISIVLVFLFRLLVDLRNETSNNNYAYNNQVNKAEIVYNVQNDLHRYELKNVTSSTSSNRVTVTFTWALNRSEGGNASSQVSTLEAWKDSSDNYFVKYTDVDKDNVQTWKIKDAIIDLTNTNIIEMHQTNNYMYFKVRLFVYNKPFNELNCAESNNEVDDIEISFSKYFKQ